RELLEFRLHAADISRAARASELLMLLPSSLDNLNARDIAQRYAQQPEELVAVLGKPGEAGPIGSLDFHPSCKMLAASRLGNHSLVRLWDLTGSQPSVRDFNTGHPCVSALVFAPDGKLLATGGMTSSAGDPVVRLWSLSNEEPKEVDVLKGVVLKDMPLPEVLAFSPDGRLLVHGGYGGTLLSEVKETKATKSGGLPLGQPEGIAFGPDSKRLAVISHYTSGESGLLVLDLPFSGQGPQELARLPSKLAFRCVAFSPDGKT